MGNYSYIEDFEGCVIDAKKIKKENCGCYTEQIKNFPDSLDGLKIQGYWYDEFIKFLYACAETMKLTDDKEDNIITIEEGTEIIYDKFSDEKIKNLIINGKLIFDNTKDTRLTVETINVNGELEIINITITKSAAYFIQKRSS